MKTRKPMTNRGQHYLNSVVEDILTKQPETRNSNEVLYMEYLRHEAPQLLCMNVETFLSFSKRHLVHSISSVSRASRKIKEIHEELREG